MPPKILGISGTNGSGKDTVGHMLEQGHNFFFVSVSDILRNYLKIQGVPLTREATAQLSSEWRRKYGLGVLIDKAIELYATNGGDQKYNGLAIASLRNPAEADSVHQYGGVVLWLDADPKIRYERIRKNQSNRGSDHAIVDNVSFEKFLADQKAEMGELSSADPTALSLNGVKSKCDLFLRNEDGDLDSLKAKLDQILGFNAS